MKECEGNRRERQECRTRKRERKQAKREGKEFRATRPGESLLGARLGYGFAALEGRL